MPQHHATTRRLARPLPTQPLASQGSPPPPCTGQWRQTNPIFPVCGPKTSIPRKNKPNQTQSTHPRRTDCVSPPGPGAVAPHRSAKARTARAKQTQFSSFLTRKRRSRKETNPNKANPPGTRYRLRTSRPRKALATARTGWYPVPSVSKRSPCDVNLQ
jgi:hypothetical protein